MKIIITLLMMCFTIVQAQTPGDSGEFRFMTYNIRVGKGLDQVKSLARIADIINREMPDIVALQEVDSATTRSGMAGQAQELGRLTGMHAVFAPAIIFDGGKYGVGILSREEPISIKRVPLPGSEEPRVLLIVEFRDFVAASTHFSLTEEDRIISAETLKAEARLFDKPMFVGGDFNALPGSEPIISIGLEFQTLSDTSQYTFPADNPTRCIDYIFAKQKGDLKYKITQKRVVREAVASDHRPVMVVLTNFGRQ